MSVGRFAGALLIVAALLAWHRGMIGGIGTGALLALGLVGCFGYANARSQS